MKKISSFIPVNIINKSILIKELSCYISKVYPIEIINNIEISSFKDNILIIICNNSSTATLMRFEKQKYIDLIKNNGIYEIDDIKITIAD